MDRDATFDEGAEEPLHLKALDADDLQVLSSLAQDAVFPTTEMSWQAKTRRFALLINRFRWEDREAAERRGRPYERVQSLLVVDDVLKVRSQGIDRSDKDVVLSILAVDFTAEEDGAGTVVLTLAGDGAIALTVEALDVTLKDVTRPYVAPSKQAPEHPE